MQTGTGPSMCYPVSVLAILLATPVLAQSLDRSNVVRGLCRPNGCEDFAMSPFPVPAA